MTNEPKDYSKLKNILAIIAFIALLAVGIWSAAQVISFIPNLFSKNGVTSGDNSSSTLTLGNKSIALRLTPETIASGKNVRIDWVRNIQTNDGVVSFSYACTEGFHFEKGTTSIPCNIPYKMTPDTKYVDLTPITNKQTLRVPLAITYTDTQNKSIRDGGTLVVINNNPTISKRPTTRSTQPTPNTFIAPPSRQPQEAPSIAPRKKSVIVPQQRIIRVPRTSNPYGVADIMIDRMKVGSITIRGTFSAKESISKYERGAVQFVVRNRGTKTTGPWFFMARVPSAQGGYIFYSKPQQSLLPGTSAVLLVTFDQLQAGRGMVTVQLDPYNYIPESNETNNIFSRPIYVLNF